MTAQIYDIITCPTCQGNKTIDGGQIRTQGFTLSVNNALNVMGMEESG